MRRAAAALLCLLLLCACAAPEQADALPQELAGSWVSAGNGDLIETMTLAQDGTISVQGPSAACGTQTGRHFSRTFRRAPRPIRPNLSGPLTAGS